MATSVEATGWVDPDGLRHRRLYERLVEVDRDSRLPEGQGECEKSADGTEGNDGREGFLLAFL